MKKLLLFLFVTITVVSCSEINYTKQFADKAPIRRFNSIDKTTKSSSGCFIIAVATYQSEETTEKYVIMYVQDKQGIYNLIKSKPEYIRFKINNNIKTPTFTYVPKWEGHITTETINTQLTDCYANYDYCIIECKDSDLPNDYNMIIY